MEEKRKIVIPIGDNVEPQSKSAQAFFDTQSKKNAQPVVSLSGDPATGPAVTAARSGKLRVLALFIVAAIFAGIAAGIYFFVVRGRGQTEPQAAVLPIAGKTLSTLPWTHTPEGPLAQDNAETPVDENNSSTDKAKDTQARPDRVADARDQKRANKQARAKPGKRNNNSPDDPVKRTQDELHRIRDIFEGPP